MQAEMFPECIRRPKQSDRATVVAAVRLVLEELEDWAGQHDHHGAPHAARPSFGEDEALVQFLERAIVSGQDGYQVAQELDRWHGFTPDAALVALLDCMPYHLFDVHNQKLQEWLGGTGARPKLTRGTEVTVEVRGVRHRGTIVEIYPNSGAYVVYVAELGHLPPGHSGGTSGVLVDWEVLEALNPSEDHDVSGV